MLYTIFSVIAPVFISAMVGYVWVRRGLAFDMDFVTRLLMEVGAPCLIFSSFMEHDITPAAFREIALASAMAMLAFGLISAPFLYFAKLDLRTWLPTQIFPNAGNMGVPLCLLAFKAEGQALAVTYFMISVVFSFTIGMAITTGRMSLQELLRRPHLYSVLLSIGLMTTGIKPPAWIFNTAKLIGSFTIPLMLIALGVSLAKFHITSMRRSLALSLLRLVMGFIVGVLVARVLGLEGTSRGVVIVESAMPVAVFSYMFAARYQRSPEEVASTVLISTVLSFASLPALLWYVL